jgi:hypothetical protein
MACDDFGKFVSVFCADDLPFSHLPLTGPALNSPLYSPPKLAAAV